MVTFIYLFKFVPLILRFIKATHILAIMDIKLLKNVYIIENKCMF